MLGRPSLGPAGALIAAPEVRTLSFEDGHRGPRPRCAPSYERP